MCGRRMLACAVQRPLPTGRFLAAMPRSSRHCSVNAWSDDDDVHCQNIPGVLQANPRGDVVLSGGEHVLPREERTIVTLWHLQRYG